MSNVVLEKIIAVDRKVKHTASISNARVPESVDKIFEWLPAIYVMLSGISGTKPSNSFMKRLLIIGVTHAVANSFISPLKKYIRRRRPGFLLKTNSFPSRHSAISFSGAHILEKHLENAHPLLRKAGYVSALTTASLRIYRQKHWLTDVIAGAVIGLLASHIVHGLTKKIGSQ